MTLTSDEVQAGLERLERQFMAPQIDGPMDVVSYETRHEGTMYVPAEYAGDVPAEYQDTIERHAGKFLAYLSAPGYMDRTDSAMFDTYDEAAEYLVETYDDDTDDEVPHVR